MKKILLSLATTFIAVALSTAGIGTTSHEEADAIVLERLSQETRPYTLYVTKELQKDMCITSPAGELLELNYWCWTYYVRYTDTNQGRYIIVNEANGNLLEVDVKSGAEPEDLAEWREIESQIVNFTPCQQSKSSSSELSDKVDVEFTDKGVQIKYYNFEVPCDFATVNVTYTFVNGVLNITQQGSPNQANCICYTDVSYTINGISKDGVNVIFINEVQVYCHNDLNIDTDMENIILGKWELVEIHPYINAEPFQLGNGEPYQPNGYYEFLPDSLVAWYDYATQKYTKLERKYWFEDIGRPINSYFRQGIMWGLHFNGKVDGDYPAPYYVQDGWGYSLYDCTFFSKDCIGLYQMVHDTYIPSPTYIYKRKR